MRIIFVSKGKKNIAPFLGFFEVLIWIIAVSKIMQNLDHYINYVAYAAGFATGNFVGMLIEERLAVGIQLIRVIISQKGSQLVHELSLNGFGATMVDAHGAREDVSLIYAIVPRNDLRKVLEIIHDFNPMAFYSIEDVRSTSEGIFPSKRSDTVFLFSNVLRRWRGGK
jgi:uncharacterized protein YebE (UPF0316 family)